ncbi:MAG: ATP-binding protein [Limnochordia bacterium]|jgi:DNA polymerase-3 subunit delta'
MTLGEVLGQPVAVTILENSRAKGRLAHAYLFYGDDGVGKETAVRILAADADLRVVEGSPSIKIEQIRMLRQQSSYTQTGSLVWLIKDAENMTVQAANAFLKVLEEPNPGVYFFLTTTNLHRILPTIVSRCQVVPFRAISEETICQFLADKFNQAQDSPRIRLLARMARGSIGRALQYWEGPVLERRKQVLGALERIPSATYPEILGLSLNWDEDRVQVQDDLQLMLGWYRDLAAVKSGSGVSLYNPDYAAELDKISSLYTYQALFEIMHEISEMQTAVAGNVRPRFALGRLFLSMKKGAHS